MSNNWLSPKIIIGSPATGSYYFNRPQIVEEIWQELEKGNYILIAAPRRVGKTSIMKYMIEKPNSGYRLVFENIQSASSEIEFYKILYKLILSCLGNLDKAKKWFSTYIKTKSITEADIKGGFKIEHTKLNYLDELNDIIPHLEKYKETIVLMIDELPEVLHQLYKKNRIDEAISILKNLRTWRQDSKFRYVKFVLSGSVGIHYVVQSIEGRNADMNDLKTVRYEAMDMDETRDYIQWATQGATVQYPEELVLYINKKVNYNVPYFLNLMLDEIDRRAKKAKNSKITQADVDQAFDLIVKNSEHFRDWKLRLSNYLPQADYKFCNEVLIHMAHLESITIQSIYDKAQKHERLDNYMELIEGLEKDGYITENNKSYYFVSPFLKAFWKNDNPFYNE